MLSVRTSRHLKNYLFCVANNTPSLATSQFKRGNVLPNVNKNDTILDKIQGNK